jgi:hypothetical protein
MELQFAWDSCDGAHRSIVDRGDWAAITAAWRQATEAQRRFVQSLGPPGVEASPAYVGEFRKLESALARLGTVVPEFANPVNPAEQLSLMANEDSRTPDPDRGGTVLSAPVGYIGLAEEARVAESLAAPSVTIAVVIPPKIEAGKPALYASGAAAFAGAVGGAAAAGNRAVPPSSAPRLQRVESPPARSLDEEVGQFLEAYHLAATGQSG